MSDETYIAEIGWLAHDGKLFVNVADLIVMLRAGDYREIADDFARIADEEERALL